MPQTQHGVVWRLDNVGSASVLGTAADTADETVDTALDSVGSASALGIAADTAKDTFDTASDTAESGLLNPQSDVPALGDWVVPAMSSRSSRLTPVKVCIRCGLPFFSSQRSCCLVMLPSPTPEMADGLF